MIISDPVTDSSEYDEEFRYRVVRELRTVPLEESREALFDALGDQSWRVRKQAIDVLLSAGIGEDILQQLTAFLSDDDNAGLRNAVAELLVRIGGRAVPVLTSYLFDTDHDVRKQVVDILGAIGNREACKALVLALSDSDCNVAAAAAEGLGSISDPDTATMLLQQLENRREPFFSFAALEALGKTGSPGPLPLIIRQLVGQDVLKRAVYECMGRIGGDMEAVELLLEGSISELVSVHQAAICSLAQVLQQLEDSIQVTADRRVKKFLNQGLLEHLINAFKPGNILLNDAVVTILARVADSRGVEVLFRALADNRIASKAERGLQKIGDNAFTAVDEIFSRTEEPAGRAAICSFLGRYGKPYNSATIRLALEDSSAQVRATAAFAAAGMNDPEIPALLIRLLEDEHNIVRDSAINTLQRYAESDAKLISEAAERMLHSTESIQRRSSAALFAALQNGERLSQLLKDEDPSVRETAARTAGKLRFKEGCCYLIPALVDENADVRIAVAETLGYCGDVEAVSPIRLSLKDTDPWVKAAALRSLVQLVGEDALPDLLQCWDSSEEVVQLVCLESFDLIKSMEGVKAVSRDLGQLDGEVLKEAIKLLHRYDFSLLTPWFNYIINHPEWDVRIAGVRACDLLADNERFALLHNALNTEKNDLVMAEIRLMLGWN